MLPSFPVYYITINYVLVMYDVLYRNHYLVYKAYHIWLDNTGTTQLTTK